MDKIHPSYLQKNEDLETYKRMAQEGSDLYHPVSVRGNRVRHDIGIPYHTTIKLFNPAKDTAEQIHETASKLDMQVPDPKTVRIEPATLVGRNGNTMHVLKLYGPHADMIKEHHKHFAHLGHPEKYEYAPHITVDKQLYDHAIHSGAKTAHDLGIEFGPAELHHGGKHLATYPPKRAHEPGEEPQKDPELGKSEDLSKSQPVITFPHSKGYQARPETQVRHITEEFGHLPGKVATSTGKISEKKPDPRRQRKIYQKQVAAARGETAKEHTIKGNIWGRSTPTSRGPMAFSLSGKMMPPHNRNPEYKTWFDKNAALVEAHDKEKDPVKKQAIYSEWKDHHYNKKPEEFLETPTESLTDKQKLARARNIETTVQHEALHNTLKNIKRHVQHTKPGEEAYKEVIDGMLEQFNAVDPKLMDTVANWIKQRGYKKEKMSEYGFKEELLTHARDILVSPEDRESFSKFTGEMLPGAGANPLVRALKLGHKKAFNYAKNWGKQPTAANPKEEASQPELAAAKVGKSEELPNDLQKSRASYTMPGLKKVPLRPETDVQVVTTPRQKEMFARKLAVAHKGTEHEGIDPKVIEAELRGIGGAASRHLPPSVSPKAAVFAGKTSPSQQPIGKMPMATKDLPEDARKQRDKFTESMQHHEAFHNTLNNIKRHFGEQAAPKVVTGMLSQFDNSTLKALKFFQSNVLGYDQYHPNFGEEVINTARDVLVDPEKRKAFEEMVGVANTHQHIQNLKHGHKKAFQYAKNLKPEDFQREEKLAASEKIENDLQKGALKNIAVAAAMGSALAGSHAHAKTPHYSSSRMLNSIAAVESSKGKQTHHKAVEGPMHHGEHAYGSYGLMPQTIRETIGMHHDLKAKHGKATKLQGEDLHHYMKDNPGLEGEIAKRHLKRLEHHFGPHPDKIGFAWNQGIAGTHKAIKEKKDVGSHPYSKKIKEAYSKEK